jgi:hypothetical protein
MLRGQDVAAYLDALIMRTACLPLLSGWCSGSRRRSQVRAGLTEFMCDRVRVQCVHRLQSSACRLVPQASFAVNRIRVIWSFALFDKPRVRHTQPLHGVARIAAVEHLIHSDTAHKRGIVT